ncbi:probable phenylalanine--tRNA ligase, mitochondrial [Sitodiplosis mosellana]|uniref:probable phenylalanine--tRNA ligase, mitochondrial n=1 Tax=Sitodiplosis mosellana TaxID=263140 RepID=UPI0024441ED6|nr:probable phenylalanine--tRNA ligase, mitochondrial [Sitodiplosis mosellana]
MLIKRKIIEKLVNRVRFCSSSVKESLIIQKTTYRTDNWTNINQRLEPFIGANLYKKYNHPLRLTQEEVVTFFKKWFNKNVDDSLDLPVYKNIGPIEANESPDKLPNAFYVNRDLILRTHTINQELKCLKMGVDNFVMILDLHRRCQMNWSHFPIFHRLNVIRSENCGNLLQRTETQPAEMGKYLKEEQQAALVELIRHLLGTDVKYRWTDANLATTQPSWMFEIWHRDEWHRISGGGLIRNEIFEKSERPNIAGWEVGIGLDRLAMILYNIFDIRLLWNADHRFLNQFQPQQISEKLHAKLAKSTEKDALKNVLQRPLMKEEDNVIKNKNTKCEMHISYILPQSVDLESFPMDELCKFILQNTENAAKTVEVYDTFFNPKLDTYVINIRVEYKLGRKRTNKEVKSLHASARAHAANNFNLTLRL